MAAPAPVGAATLGALQGNNAFTTSWTPALGNMLCVLVQGDGGNATPSVSINDTSPTNPQAFYNAGSADNVSSSTGGFTQLWYIPNTPNRSVAIKVTAVNMTKCTVCVFELSGVSHTSPRYAVAVNTGFSTAPSVSPSPHNSNDIIILAAGEGSSGANNFAISTTGTTGIGSMQGGPSANCLDSRYVVGLGVATYAWSCPVATYWSALAITFDGASLVHTVTAADSIPVQPDALRIAIPARGVRDNIAVGSDKVGRGVSRSLAASLVVGADAVVRAIIRPQSEGIPLGGDSLRAGIARFLTASIPIGADIGLAIKVKLRTAADAIAIGADGISSTAVSRVLTELIPVADTLTKAVSRFLSEAIPFQGDDIPRHTTLVAVADSIAIGLDSVRRSAYGRAVGEAIAIGSTSLRAAVARGLSENLAIGATSVARGLIRALSEAIPLRSDVVNPPTFNRSRTVSEILPLLAEGPRHVTASVIDDFSRFWNDRVLSVSRGLSRRATEYLPIPTDAIISEHGDYHRTVG